MTDLFKHSSNSLYLIKLLLSHRCMLYRASAHVISDAPLIAVLSEAKKVSVGETSELPLDMHACFFYIY